MVQIGKQAGWEAGGQDKGHGYRAHQRGPWLAGQSQQSKAESPAQGPRRPLTAARPGHTIHVGVTLGPGRHARTPLLGFLASRTNLGFGTSQGPDDGKRGPKGTGKLTIFLLAAQQQNNSWFCVWDMGEGRGERAGSWQWTRVEYSRPCVGAPEVPLLSLPGAPGPRAHPEVPTFVLHSSWPIIPGLLPERVQHQGPGRPSCVLLLPRKVSEFSWACVGHPTAQASPTPSSDRKSWPGCPAQGNGCDLLDTQRH